jgi:hypothetical protein
MGGLCNSIGSNQVYYEISVEQLIVGKLQVKKKDSLLAVIIVTQKYEDNFEVLSSVVDPEPHGSALVLVGWVRIRIHEGKKDPQKLNKFHVLKYWMLSFEG